jgi:hypothetical protein
MIQLRTTLGLLPLLALGLLGTASTSPGQLPVSRPGGIVTKTIKGGGGFTTIGLPFTLEPAARAVVATGTSGTTLNAVGTPFTAGAFVAPNAPHSVVFLTGTNRGVNIRITANTASSLTLASSVPGGLVVNADEFYVIPEWTFGSLFGTGLNPSGLASNSDSALADLVYIGDGTGNLVPYFHNNSNWRRVTGSPANANNVSVGGLNGGCMVLKRSAGDLTFAVKGILRTGRQVSSVVNGFSIMSFTDPAGTTLLGTGLVPGVLTANASSALADIVSIPDATGARVQYFHNGTNWRRVTGSPASQNTLPIPADTALFIQKRSAGTSTWLINEQFAQ